MGHCFLVSDLHGRINRYEALFAAIRKQVPEAVFIAGDILPNEFARFSQDSPGSVHQDFINGFLAAELSELKDKMGQAYPRIFLILGNDDPRFEEAAIMDASARGMWEYVHNRIVEFGKHKVLGYSYVPPTPFGLKDWERYDVSAFVDPGCTHPYEGRRTFPVSEQELLYSTIKDDLMLLTGKESLENAICLFHSPPYQTLLDRAALDGKMVDYAPLDVHIGSIAIRRFIEARQPLAACHGHVHESTRITGAWMDRIGRTVCLQPAHDGPELSLISFDPDHPESASRVLIAWSDVQ